MCFYYIYFSFLSSWKKELKERKIQQQQKNVKETKTNREWNANLSTKPNNERSREEYCNKKHK